MSLVRVQLEEPDFWKSRLALLVGIFSFGYQLLSIPFYLHLFISRFFSISNSLADVIAYAKNTKRSKTTQQAHITSNQTLIVIFCFDKREKCRYHSGQLNGVPP
ncbi:MULTISPECIES: hypothetical protein [Xenorhabdus]|uniref:hypothetical protein n=1 Tax=Xenorhabdus TaxID=626 RepID=UPI000C04EE01|nr:MULTISPECIES: hypothetical protein [Xenorhabdus]